MKRLAVLLVFFTACGSLKEPLPTTIRNDVPGWTFKSAAVWEDEMIALYQENTYGWEAVVIHAPGMIPRTVVKKAEGLCFSNSLAGRDKTGAYIATPLSTCACEEFDVTYNTLEEALKARRNLDRL